MASSNPIEQSFELAAARCENLTPLVYRRLFLQHPETESMFRRETGGLVKGSMLALAVDALLDFAGDRRGNFRMIGCEVQSHDAYGTPRELFVAFFGVIAQTLREILERVVDELNRRGFPRRAKRDSSLWPGGGRQGWRMERLFGFG
jgi:hemoglobin-like flavoprotein